MSPPNKEQKKSGLLYGFNMIGFLKSLPQENAEYMQVLQQTQGKHYSEYDMYLLRICLGFNEFIHEREAKPASDPSVMLFDQMILSKRNRGRASMFSKSKTDFLSDTYDHLWRTAAATPPKGRIPGDVRAIITRGSSTPTRYFSPCEGFERLLTDLF